MPMSKIIMKVITERHEDVQSPGTEYECQIIILDDKRIFSTEDKSYLLNSTNLFKENGVTLLLDADRNSLELPELGPMMDIETYSPLRITRDGEHLIIGSGYKDHFKKIGFIKIEEWNSAIKNWEASLS
jgi:hypothetical protein